MVGSTLAVVVMPIVIVIVLAIWLCMVFYADSHPRYGNSTIPGHESSGPARLQDAPTVTIPRPRTEAPVSPGQPVGSGGKSPSEHASR